MLKRRSIKMVEAEEKVNTVDVRKEEGCLDMGALTGCSPIFTPRSSHLDVTAPNLNPSPQLPPTSSFPHFSPPSYLWIPTPSLTTSYSPPPCGLIVVDVWCLPFMGWCHCVLTRPQRVPQGTRLLDFQITTRTLLGKFYYSTEQSSSCNFHLFCQNH